tara:strand:- start:442 stop:1023 length:582 start_codon:yes stop_codon:yes gene_type:complete
MRSFKEYISGFSIGPTSHLAPIASLGDTPPKGAQHRSKRAVGINANTDKTLYMKLLRKAMSTMPGSQKQKDIKKEIEKVQKRLGIKKEDTNRIPRKPGQKAGSDKHSDLYTDENPKGTIHGLGFTDSKKARESVNKIKNSGKTHAHKMQAAIAMSQRAKVASERAKDPEKKKNLGQAHKIYQTYIDTNKKSKD